MYLDYFHLNKHPFKLTIDQEFFYWGKSHAQAKALLEYALLIGDSSVVITGEIGSGKTSLVQDILSGLDKDVIVASIFQTQLNEIQFLQSLLVEFGFEPYKAEKVELLAMINRYLIEQYKEEKKVVLVIDDAQNFDATVLEEVRLLTGFETANEKLLTAILVGQPELNQVLDSSNMQQLVQRVRFRYHIDALDLEETGQYIQHRLKVAGNKIDELFHADVWPIIYQYTGGIPRLINVLCDTALVHAFASNKKIVTMDLISDVVNELDWLKYEERRKSIYSKSLVSRIPEALNPVLVQTVNGHFVAEYPITKPIVKIGRSKYNDIHIVDLTVSRQHAQITNCEGVLQLQDMSSNGTLVNGAPVKAHVLQNGDLIIIGEYQLMYVDSFAS